MTKTQLDGADRMGDPGRNSLPGLRAVKKISSKEVRAR